MTTDTTHRLRAMRTPIARIPDVLPPSAVSCRHLAAIAERDRVLHLLHRRPASTIADVSAAMGITQNAASIHLAILARLGLARAVKQGRNRLFFATREAASAATRC